MVTAHTQSHTHLDYNCFFLCTVPRARIKSVSEPSMEKLEVAVDGEVGWRAPTLPLSLIMTI